MSNQELCKLCQRPKSALPPVKREPNDRIWICPTCGNQGKFDPDHPFGTAEVLVDAVAKPEPMTAALETK